MDVIDRYLSVHEHALAVRSKRATILASNLVNTDTPGFKPRDINFKAAMDDLLQLNKSRFDASAISRFAQSSASDHRPGTLPLSQPLLNRADIQVPGITPKARAEIVQAHTHYRAVEQVAPDGNNVNSEKERALFTENSIRLEATMQLLSMRISGLIKAIRGE